MEIRCYDIITILLVASFLSAFYFFLPSKERNSTQVRKVVYEKFHLFCDRDKGKRKGIYNIRKEAGKKKKKKKKKKRNVKKERRGR